MHASMFWFASKRHVRRKSCTAKKRFDTIEDARRAVGYMKMHKGGTTDHRHGNFSVFDIHAYECDYCGKYHVGHKPFHKSGKERK